MRKAALDPAPLVLAFVLGSILETNFRRTPTGRTRDAVAVLRGRSP